MGGDHSFEDYDKEGDGVVANLSCPKCNSFVLAYSGEIDGRKDE